MKMFQNLQEEEVMNDIWVMAIIITIGGIALFYLLKERKVQILVHNYDGKKSFVLGSFNVNSFKVNDSSYLYTEPKASFDFDNKHVENEFLHKIISGENYFGAVKYLSENIHGKENFLFKNDNSFYVLFKNKEDRYTIKPIYSIYTFANTGNYIQYRFVCPLDSVFDNSEIPSVKHSMTSKQFFSFYEALSEHICIVDRKNSTVRVNAFDIFNSKMTNDYPIEIKFSKDTLKVSLQYEKGLDVIA